MSASCGVKIPGVQTDTANKLQQNLGRNSMLHGELIKGRGRDFAESVPILPLWVALIALSASCKCSFSVLGSPEEAHSGG